MRQAYVFALPSRAESLPMALIARLGVNDYAPPERYAGASTA